MVDVGNGLVDGEVGKELPAREVCNKAKSFIPITFCAGHGWRTPYDLQS